jgi:hypothetical protein
MRYCVEQPPVGTSLPECLNSHIWGRVRPLNAASPGGWTRFTYARLFCPAAYTPRSLGHTPQEIDEMPHPEPIGHRRDILGRETDGFTCLYRALLTCVFVRVRCRVRSSRATASRAETVKSLAVISSQRPGPGADGLRSRGVL